MLRLVRCALPAGTVVFLRLEELEHRTTPSGLNVVPEQFTTNQYTAFTVGQSQLLAGDTASAPLQASNPTQPANATLVDNHNGTFTFTPNPSFSGSTTFQYTVSAASQSQLPGDAFGSVAIDGDTAVIGAPTYAGQGAGAAYVFVRSGAVWTQQAELTAPAGTGFGNDVSLSGDTAVIGASSAAYVFVRSGAVWTQQAELTPTDGTGAAQELYGSRVAVSGDTAVIAAQAKTVNGNANQGAAYVFVRSGNTWSQQAELTASDGAAGDSFGTSVSLSGDTAVIGAAFKTIDGNANQGAAYVFVRSGSIWSQQAELTAADGAAKDGFGNAVSLSGDTAVIGAPFKTLNGGQFSPPGAAYVFVRSGSTWSQQAELTASDNTNTNFGFSVAVSGDTAAIGATTSDGPGATYFFMRSGSTWSQQAELTAPDGGAFGVLDAFGVSSLSGDTALIGRSYKDKDAGAAYVFVFSGSVWTQLAEFMDPGLTPATATATVQVNPATAQLLVSPTNLAVGIEGQVYPTTTFTATGGAGSGYTFQESGILPAGIAFDPATGQLTGTPTQVGNFPGIVIAASDGHGGSGSQTYTLIVNHFGVNGLPVPYPVTIYAPPTLASDPNAGLDAFVRGLYHSVLDRDVESASSLTYWENVFTTVQTNPQLLGIAAGTDPYLYVAQGFWNSQEHRQDEVMTYYQDFLGRTLDLSNPYDATALAYWTNHFLLLGWQEADVTRGFLTSPEYLYDHRADASLANALNTNLLSGVATTADLQTWNSDLSALDMQRAAIQNQTFATPEDYKAQLSADLGALDDETAKTGVLFDMLGSSEYEQAAVQSFYLAFLRRSSTPSEVQGWLAQRDASGNPLDLGTIAAMMLASPEYRTNAANSVA